MHLIVPKLLDILDLNIAKDLINNSKKKDIYFVYDLEFQSWKNQSWCDHNVFGFYPSNKCNVYSLIQLKEEVERLNK